MKLSVSITTYNHEKFIAKAIESALNQNVDFDYEILVGEDDSEDATRDIVRQYKERYPDRIRTFLNDRKNVIYINGRATGRWNFINNLRHCRGEYIAVLEGDDYWTDANKLQTQVSFLDTHTDYSECFHWAGWLLENKAKIAHWNYGPPVIKGHYTIDDLFIYGNFIPTSSMVFRRKTIAVLPDWFYHISIGDLPLHVLNGQEGKIGFIDQKMSVYRRHDGGLYSGSLKYKNIESTIDAIRMLGNKLNLSTNNNYRVGLSNYYARLSGAYIEEGKFVKAVCAASKSIRSSTPEHRMRTCRYITQNIRKALRR